MDGPKEQVWGFQWLAGRTQVRVWGGQPASGQQVLGRLVWLFSEGKYQWSHRFGGKDGGRGRAGVRRWQARGREDAGARECGPCKSDRGAVLMGGKGSGGWCPVHSAGEDLGEWEPQVGGGRWQGCQRRRGGRGSGEGGGLGQAEEVEG